MGKEVNNEIIEKICMKQSDEEKIEFLDEIENEYHKEEIIKSMSSDENKIKALDKMKNDYHKANIIRSLSNDENKIKALDKIENDSGKLNIVVGLQNDENKIKALNKIEDECCKTEIIKSLSSDEKKIELLDRIEENHNKAEIIKSLSSDEKKMGFLDEIEDNYDKEKIIKSMSSDEKKIEALEKIGYKSSNIIALKDIWQSNKSDEMKKYLNNETENQTLGLPYDMKIGVELEVEGTFAKFVMDHKSMMNTWEIKYDRTLNDGVEVASPILQDKVEDMQAIEIVCNVMQEVGLEATQRCGGHIHIGAEYLEDNPQALENMMTIWNECEELFYKMGNEKGVVPREGITKYAIMSHPDIEEIFKKGKIEIKDEFDFQKIREDLIYRERKNRGLNLEHYGEQNKNTIEFRIPNGTLNPKTIKENIKLFGSLLEISKEMALNPEYKKEEFERIKDRSLTEGEKVEALLNLLFDDEKTKSIYRERWDSVKGEKIFDELTDEKITPTFERGNYEIRRENIKEVANSKEAIQEISGVAGEIRREIEQQKQISGKDEKQNNDE